jgi:hypothetical protein
MRFTLQILFVLLISSQFNIAKAQNKPLTVVRYTQKDSLKFKQQISYFDYNYNQQLYGNTVLLMHCQSDAGTFEFVFKKKVRKLSRTIIYDTGGVGEIFDFKTNKWKHEEGTWKHAEMKGKPTDTTLYSEHDLYAFVLVPDDGGVVTIAKFQDFGNEVYWPEFDLGNCSVSDENNDGNPEFYLSYMGESDGLDAKPYKQIVYTIPHNGTSLLKSKATAHYPAGNEDDQYIIEYDANWKALSKAIQKKSNDILSKHRKMYMQD